MSTIRLSICITTYNRAAFVGETLQSIISQLPEEAELIVLNDRSPDNTVDVVRKFEHQCPRLRYVEVDLGESVEQKYCRLVTLAQGEYCWLFADDDLIKPGGVAVVLEATKRNYALIVINTEVRDKDLAVCLQSQGIKVEHDRIYTTSPEDQNKLLVEVSGHLSFVGAMVIRKDIWLQREKGKYFGTGWVHVGVVFQSPLPGNTLLISKPWVIIRFGNAQWMSQGFEICFVNWPTVIQSATGFAEWAKRIAGDPEPWRSYQKLLFLRALGRFSSNDYERWLAARIKSPVRRLLTRAIAGAPVCWVNFFARYYARWILRKNPSLGLYELEAWHKEHVRRHTARQT